MGKVQLVGIPHFALKPRPTGILYLGMPRPYRADCSKFGGKFWHGRSTEVGPCMTVQVFDYYQSENVYGDYLVLAFLDTDRAVSLLVLRGESEREFRDFLYQLEVSGPENQAIALDALKLTLGFEERSLGTGDVYHTVVVQLVEFVSEQALEDIRKFVQSGRFMLSSFPVEQVGHDE
ncbi:hypothetical protein [Candidatus Cyanaurora vandensis]|uniref:hypothetical protein n=1 Tax=Candidatus Cyanaurora vandensis TaxID=2714958 RepID=UPI00257C3216|nr:hypothetical protein [Candidatus Cyanaurora vandensis]